MTRLLQTRPRFTAGGYVVFIVVLVVMAGLIAPRSLALLPSLAGLGIYALWPRLTGEERPRVRGLMAIASGIVAMAAASSLWAIAPDEALERAAKIGVVLIPGMLWVAVTWAMPQSWKGRIAHSLIAGTAAVAAWFAIEFALDQPVMRMIHEIQTQGAETFPRYGMNRMVVTLVLVFLPLVVMMRRAGTVFAPRAAAFILIAAVLWQTHSQSAQMAFIAGIAVLFLFPTQWRPAWWMAKAVCCAVILALPFAAMSIFAAIPHETMAQDLHKTLLDRANLLPRLEIWDYVSRYAMEHFWFGAGVEATRAVPAFDSAEIYQGGKTLLHPHNVFLQIWIEFGATGAILACAAASFLLHRIAVCTDGTARRLYLATTVALCAVGFVGYGMWQGWWIGLILMIAGLCGIATPSRAHAANPAAQQPSM